jgi:EAL domain-containing protein (putative c-di-GMP-specific phosphodiesterase class I)
LTIEVTESSVIRHVGVAIARLQAVRQLGVGVALDDFGTGHSNFTYLKALPINAIKLDRSFLTAVGTEKRDRILVSTMISMARSLGLETVAEGVETQAQLRFLKSEGCDRYQGFYCSPPLTVRELEPFSRRWSSNPKSRA